MDRTIQNPTRPLPLLRFVFALLFLLVAAAPARSTQIVGWGKNFFGELTVPAGLTNAVSIAGSGYNAAAAKDTGIVLEWGAATGPTNVPAFVTNVSVVSIGQQHGLGLRYDGSLVTWGANYSGVVSNVPAVNNAISISAGYTHDLALTADGKILAWGDNFYGQSSVPPVTGSVIGIASGDYHSLAVNNAGQVLAWGYNYYGQTNVPAGLSNVVAVGACNDYSVALKSDGTLVMWGDGSWGQTTVPPGLSNVVAIACGSLHVLALKANGTVVAWGNNSYAQTNVPAGLSNVIAIAATAGGSLALTNDGSPAIVRQPATQAVDPGANLSLNVAAVGVAPLAYQWYFNNSPVSGATDSILALNNFQPTNAGTYSVVITNNLGTVTSTSATLTYGALPQAAIQPAAIYVLPGTNAVFSTVTAGSPQLSYQWSINGTAIVGATNATLSIANSQASDTGSYSVIVSNSFGSFTSQPAVLSVVTNPPQLVTTSSQIIEIGSITALSTSATSGSPPAYQWRYNGNPIANVTNSVYSFTAQSNNVGTYDVIVSNIAGSTTSDPILLDTYTAPESLVVTVGSNATFSSTTAGPSTLSAQWLFNGSPLPGATNDSLTITNAQLSDTGNYTIQYSTGSIAVTSSVARLSVIQSFPTNSGPIVTPSGMVDWWPADGNGNDIFGGYNITNQLTYGPGEVQSAFSFNGTTINCPIRATNLPPPWTVAFWLNRQNSSDQSASLLTDRNYALKIEQYGTPRRIGITRYGTNGYDLAFNYIAPQNTWVHLAFVATTNNQTMLFVNGAFQDVLNTNQPLARSNLCTSIAIEHIRGSIDELMVFNRALSDYEIYAMNATSTNGCVKAPEFLSINRIPGQVSLNLCGQTDKTISLYSSSNLIDWTFLGTQPNPAGTLQFTNTPAAIPVFYKASQP